MIKKLLLSGLLLVLCCNFAMAGSTDVPRVLVVGDSWAAFVQIYRCFDFMAKGQAGLVGFGQRGQRTTQFGLRASEFDDPAWLDKVTQELNDYPTIDIVHLSLGGNDFVLDSEWTPSMPPEQLEAFINTVNAHTESVIDHILSIRPNIRVVLCGYTYGNHPMGGGDVAQMNAVWVQFERSRLDMCLGKDRTYYVHNLGLMQRLYGIPEASPPVPAAPAAGCIPMPSGHADNYIPFPGGNPLFNAPLSSLADDDMHLTMEGYDAVTQRCIDEFYREFLSWPAVLEILPQEQAKSPTYTYEVTFSEPVTGVNEGDFVVSGGASVTGVSGSGAEYAVTVDGAGQTTPPLLEVIDDDTIRDIALNPLGGVGDDNGGFAYNGPVAFADPTIQSTSDFDTCLFNLDGAFLSVNWILDGKRFDSEHCDANGGDISLTPPDIVGNNMLDACEFGLIEECLNNPARDLGDTGGVTHNEVVAAWEKNYNRMLSDLGGPNGRFPVAIPGIESLMAGFMTLGDPGSTPIPTILIVGIKGILGLPPGVSVPKTSNYTLMDTYFGPDGDADGDGFSNRAEYEYFMPIGGRDLYIKSALDPAAAPEVTCTNTTGGIIDEGDDFCLVVPDKVDLTGGFVWKKNGEPLVFSKHVNGVNWRQLQIHHLVESDNGSYTCENAAGDLLFGPVELEVNTNVAPAMGLFGLVGLAGVLGLAGMRRMKK